MPAIILALRVTVMVKALLSRLEENLLCLILVSMTSLVFAEVIARFFFNSGIHWAQEMTLIMSSWLVLIGASYGVKVGSHIGVNVFINLLPVKPHKYVSLLSIGLCLIYTNLFLYGSGIYIVKLKQIGIEMNDIPVPKWIPTSVLVLCFMLLNFRLISLFYDTYIGTKNGFNLSDEAKDAINIANELKNTLNNIPIDNNIKPKEAKS